MTVPSIMTARMTTSAPTESASQMMTVPLTASAQIEMIRPQMTAALDKGSDIRTGVPNPDSTTLRMTATQIKGPQTITDINVTDSVTSACKMNSDSIHPQRIAGRGRRETGLPNPDVISQTIMIESEVTTTR